MSSIRVQNLTKKFDKFLAVSDLSFEISENHIVGFLGPNGAGKTTTLRMLVGLSKPNDGQIEIAGKKIIFGKTSAANFKVGYLPELPSMYGWMSGREYLKLIASAFHLSAKVTEKRITELVKLVNLVDAIDRRISTYSGGMKQRLGIAQALINNPEVIIMDEPVSALDPIGRKEVLEVIKKLRNNHTILFSTHILSDVDKICDDLVIINHGKLVTAAPLDELKAKYAKPILEVDFVKSPKNILPNLIEQHWVKRATIEGNRLRIWLNDEKIIDSNTPLNYLLKHNIGIKKYSLEIPETEDLFIELLGEKHE